MIRASMNLVGMSENLSERARPLSVAPAIYDSACSLINKRKKKGKNLALSLLELLFHHDQQYYANQEKDKGKNAYYVIPHSSPDYQNS